MSHVDQASQIVRRAVGELRELASTALSEQAFREVAEIARMAEAVAAVLGDTTPQHGSESVAPESEPTSRPPKRTRTKRTGSSRKSYPRIERDGNKLVKIGWSKKSRSEYEHRAPFSVAERLVTAIQGKVTAGELFAATDVLPVLDADGEAIPDYQVYLALKWLHTEGVVTKHGRDRYAVEPGRLDDDTLERLWSGLPKFNGASR